MARTQIRGSQLLDGEITDADVASANKDGAAGTASMRTLGTGAQQAAAGNHSHAGGGSVPAGVIYGYGGASAPSGYLLCDGAAVSRTTYAGLFTAIGTAFGAGDGSTTFNVPDLRGRSPVGLGTHADNNALGDSDGVAVGSRTSNHNHDLATGVGGNVLRFHSTNQNLFWNKAGWNQVANTASGTPDTGIGTDTKSTPWLTVNYIIKT